MNSVPKGPSAQPCLSRVAAQGSRPDSGSWRQKPLCALHGLGLVTAASAVPCGFGSVESRKAARVSNEGHHLFLLLPFYAPPPLPTKFSLARELHPTGGDWMRFLKNWSGHVLLCEPKLPDHETHALANLAKVLGGSSVPLRSPPLRFLARLLVLGAGGVLGMLLCCCPIIPPLDRGANRPEGLGAVVTDAC